MAVHFGQVFKHLQVALYDRQKVVEVVRNAARQLAHAFKPLRMAERLFRLRALQTGGQHIAQGI